MRQINWVFRIELSAILRDHNLVGDNIINKICTHGAGVPKIIYLNWCSAIGKNARSAISCISGQIYCYVDFILPRQKPQTRKEFAAIEIAPMKVSKACGWIKRIATMQNASAVKSKVAEDRIRPPSKHKYDGSQKETVYG